MTSQNPARIVLRRKPRRWGHQKLTTAALRSRATTCAILFSKPSSLSLEKGMSYGSTHTRSSEGARRAAPATRTTPAAATSDAALRLRQERCIVLPAHCERVHPVHTYYTRRRSAFASAPGAPSPCE